MIEGNGGRLCHTNQRVLLGPSDIEGRVFVGESVGTFPSKVHVSTPFPLETRRGLVRRKTIIIDMDSPCVYCLSPVPGFTPQF